MMNEKVYHRDCRNYTPVDVAKGICHRTKDLVVADGDRCEQFQLLPRCRHCLNYIVDAQAMGVGICKASKNRFLAYGDMTAVTCEQYRTS
jgi:4-hydroxyphenylacetate decarboxylase small subunit